MKFWTVVAAVGTASLLLAACGSSSSTKAASPPPTTGTSAPTGAASVPAAPTSAAPSGSTIKIGLIGGQTGPDTSTTSQGATVGPAWAKYINAAGGIAGHPVQVIIGDDGSDPTKAQAAEKTLVGDGVVAIVVASDNLVTAFDADALAKGVPLVSGSANAVDWYTKPGMFATTTDNVSGLVDQILVAKEVAHATKFADLYCSEVAACAMANPVLQGAATKVGLGFTSLGISSTATSYTAECLKLQQEKVDYAALNFSAGAAAKFASDCAQQGYKPTYGLTSESVGSELLGVQGLTAFGPSYAFPSVLNSPAAQTFRDAMTKYASGSNYSEGVGSFAWTGLEAVHAALASAGTSVTAADVTSGLNALKGSTLNGLSPNPFSWSTGKPVAFTSAPCAFVIGISGGKTVAPLGTKTICSAPAPAAG